MPKWAWYICKSEQHHFFKLWGGTVHNWKKMSICSKVCFLENPTNPRLRWALPGRFVPAQRWLHNIEHGAIVMLYHPCTHHTLVEKLRALVKGCIRYIVESICISTLCTTLSGNTSSLPQHWCQRRGHLSWWAGDVGLKWDKWMSTRCRCRCWCRFFLEILRHLLTYGTLCGEVSFGWWRWCKSQ